MYWIILESNTILEVLQSRLKPVAPSRHRYALKELLKTRFSRDDTSPTAALLQLVPRMLCTKSTDGLVDKLFYEDDVYQDPQACRVK